MFTNNAFGVCTCGQEVRGNRCRTREKSNCDAALGTTLVDDMGKSGAKTALQNYAQLG